MDRQPFNRSNTNVSEVKDKNKKSTARSQSDHTYYSTVTNNASQPSHDFDMNMEIYLSTPYNTYSNVPGTRQPIYDNFEYPVYENLIPIAQDHSRCSPSAESFIYSEPQYAAVYENEAADYNDEATVQHAIPYNTYSNVVETSKRTYENTKYPSDNNFKPIAQNNSHCSPSAASSRYSKRQYEAGYVDEATAHQAKPYNTYSNVAETSERLYENTKHTPNDILKPIAQDYFSRPPSAASSRYSDVQYATVYENKVTSYKKEATVHHTKPYNTYSNVAETSKRTYENIKNSPDNNLKPIAQDNFRRPPSAASSRYSELPYAPDYENEAAGYKDDTAGYDEAAGYKDEATVYDNCSSRPPITYEPIYEQMYVASPSSTLSSSYSMSSISQAKTTRKHETNRPVESQTTQLLVNNEKKMLNSNAISLDRTCKKCLKIVKEGSEFISKGNMYHINCFIYSYCGCELKNEKFYQINGKLNCPECCLVVCSGQNVIKRAHSSTENVNRGPSSHMYVNVPNVKDKKKNMFTAQNKHNYNNTVTKTKAQPSMGIYSNVVHTEMSRRTYENTKYPVYDNLKPTAKNNLCCPPSSVSSSYLELKNASDKNEATGYDNYSPQVSTMCEPMYATMDGGRPSSELLSAHSASSFSQTNITRKHKTKVDSLADILESAMSVSKGKNVSRNHDAFISCFICQKPIIGIVLKAVGHTYHSDCFRCVVCFKSLDGVQFTIDTNSQIYCINDYNEKFAPKCSACGYPITQGDNGDETLRLVALDRSFHIQCYKCEDCDTLLGSSAEDRGCYPLDGHVLCKSCNVKRVNAIT